MSNFKFNARIVDSIESVLKESISTIATKFTVKSYAIIIQHAYVNGNKVGMKYDKAFKVIDDYKGGVFQITIDVMESLVDAGFLPRSAKTTLQEMKEELKAPTNPNEAPTL